MTLYRLLLRVFPPAFRARFGDDITEVFSDRLARARTQGLVAAIRLWCRTIGDVVEHGLTERYRARGRRERSDAMWQSVFSDVRFGLRRLRRRPAFTVIVLVTLGLGIGAATSVFSVANALLLQRLPYPDANRLMRLFERQDQEGFSGNVALGNLDAWCGVPGIESCGAYTTGDVNLAGGPTPERVRAASATIDLFRVLGTVPLHGRLFSAADVPPAAPVVLITDRAARRLLGSAEVVGRPLILDGVNHTVAGVIPAPPGLDSIAIWRPLATTNQPRTNHAYRGMVKLRAHASALTVQHQLDVQSRRLQEQLPDSNAHWWASIEPLQQSLTSDITGTLRALGALVAVLVLLCATNVAGLVSGQTWARGQEMSVRLSMGADGRRLLRQLLVENAVIALGGAALGALMAHWTVAGVVAVLPSNLTMWRTPAVSGTALGFAMLLSAGAALVFGVAPSAALVRRTLAARELRTALSVTSTQRTRSILAGVQTALAAVLLTAAALLGTVLLRLVLIDPGFHPENVLTFRVAPPRAAYADAAALNTFFESLETRLRRLPQVEAVSAAMALPTQGPNVARGVIRVGEPLPSRPRQTRLTLFQVTTPEYFRTLGIPLLEGRDFAPTDTASAPPVAIVNEHLAKILWPGQQATGQQLLIHTDEQTPRTVIGVAKNIRQSDLEDEITSLYYVPLRQSPRRTLSFVVRVADGGAPLDRAGIQAEVSALDPALPLYDIAPLDTLVARSTADRKALTGIAVFFSAVALLLTALGLYGLVSAIVLERRREIGLRLALGATPSSILGLVMRRGVVLSVLGLIAGLSIAAPATSLLRQLLTSAPPSSALTMTVVGVVLLGVVVTASWIPARRALGIDPARALRAD